MTQSKASSIIALTLFATMFATFFAVGPAWGQEVTATITGSVTDPTGAPLVGASVVARDVDRGTTFATQTNGDGVFNLQRLPVGTYEIKVTAAGFRTAQQSAVTLVLDQIARFTFQLQVRSVTEVMEVIDQASENAVGFTPSPDAIQEFNVITQNASAEFGNFQGGVVSASIKSGTNTFHGDVFEF